MARVNAGVDPRYLSDQHLIAESVEITMITGNLKVNKNKIVGDIPAQFCLGPGHINFFKDKLIYLAIRLSKVNAEMIRRGFSPGTSIRITEYPQELWWGWNPSPSDTDLVKNRICERLMNPKKAKAGFHKYYGKPIADIQAFCQELLISKRYFV